MFLEAIFKLKLIIEFLGLKGGVNVTKKRKESKNKLIKRKIERRIKELLAKEPDLTIYQLLEKLYGKEKVNVFRDMYDRYRAVLVIKKEWKNQNIR